MTGQELLTQAYIAYRGKGASRVPAWGTEKANTAISIANRKQQEWARDSFHRWNSLFSIKTVGTINTSNDTYPLPTGFMGNSDFAKVIKTDNSIVEYPVVLPQQRDQFDQALYVLGTNIVFAQSIDAGLTGGTLKLAAYYIPDDIVNDTDTVAVDDPNWLVYIVAAELARNDPARDDQVGNLVAQANDLYQKMIVNNALSGYLQPNRIETNVPTIGSALDENWAGGGVL